MYVRPPFHSKRTALLLSWSPMFRGQNLLRESRSFTTSSQLPFHFLFLPFYFSIPTFIYLFHILNIFYNSSNFHFSTLIPHDSKNILFLFRGGSYCVIFFHFYKPCLYFFFLFFFPISFNFYGRITISHKYKLHAVRWTQYFFESAYYHNSNIIWHKKRWIWNWGLIVYYNKVYIHIFCVLLFCNQNYGK